MGHTDRFKRVKASLRGGWHYILASPCLPCWQQHRGESDWLAFRLAVNKASGRGSSSITRPRRNCHRNKCTPICSSAGQLLGMRTRLCLFPTNSSFFCCCCCCCFVALLRRAAVEPSGSSWIGWGFGDVTAEPSITYIAVTVTPGFTVQWRHLNNATVHVSRWQPLYRRVFSDIWILEINTIFMNYFLYSFNDMETLFVGKW